MSEKSAGGHSRRMMTMDIKQEIIDKHEHGAKVSELAKQYSRNPSTICTIVKNKDAIKRLTPAKGITTMSRRRTATHERMEHLLLVWIQEKQLAGDSVSEAIICEKARQIYGDLLKQLSSEERESVMDFHASSGWFKNFRKRSSIHSVVRHGEAASSDVQAAKDFITTFGELIEAEGYIPQQVFNCDETGLFWKKMPRRTFITMEEKKMPGHKPMKDRLTLALCANASGDCKIKPLLIYHSENPRAFKSHKVLKEKLNVMWRANKKAWVTRQFFTEWVNLVFGPSVKKYLTDNNLPLQALLVLDNAPAHPPGLKDDILEEFQFIDVLYLPPNTTPILQPMDQQVIANFKKQYTRQLFKRCFEITESTNLTLREFWKDHFNIVLCLRLIDTAWQGVSRKSLHAAWKQLWPDMIEERDFEGFEPDDPNIVEEIVSMGKTMGLEVDEGDVNELVVEHEEELTTEELQELHAEQQVIQDVSSGEEDEPQEVTSTAEIRNILEMWEQVSQFVEKKHPEKVRTGRAAVLYNDTCLTHFKNILKGRQKQASIHKYFKGENDAKRAKQSEEN